MLTNLELKQRFCTGIDMMEIKLNDNQIENSLQLIQLLVQWNKAYNLTSIRDPIEMIGYHLLDSLSLMPFIHTSPILDIGTGAGFPGLPLAIAYPELTFTLIDSNGKKIRFVRQAITELKLKNVIPIQTRIETYIPTTKFPIIIARALASLSQLSIWANKLLTPEGRLFACKNNNANQELVTINSALVKLHQLHVPYVKSTRVLYDIKNQYHTT